MVRSCTSCSAPQARGVSVPCLWNVGRRLSLGFNLEPALGLRSCRDQHPRSTRITKGHSHPAKQKEASLKLWPVVKSIFYKKYFYFQSLGFGHLGGSRKRHYLNSCSCRGLFSKLTIVIAPAKSKVEGIHLF